MNINNNNLIYIILNNINNIIINYIIIKNNINKILINKILPINNLIII